MKKNAKYTSLLLAVLALVAVVGSSRVNAQAVACPAGYVCTPNTLRSECPVGYTCTRTTNPNDNVITTNDNVPVDTNSCYIFNLNLNPSGTMAMSTGPNVTALQNLLVSKGFVAPVNGRFDTVTKNAVMLFQRSLGLPVTGFVGPLTRAVLNSNCGNNATTSISVGTVQNRVGTTLSVLTPTNKNRASTAVFKSGDSMNIQWSSQGVKGVRRIRLVSADATKSSIEILNLNSSSTSPQTTDSYSWTIPATVTTGSYRVYVQVGFDSSIVASAYSASTVYVSGVQSTIAPQSTIQANTDSQVKSVVVGNQTYKITSSLSVLTPVNSQRADVNIFKSGDIMNIKWSSQGVRGVRRIRLVPADTSKASIEVLKLSSASEFPLTTDSYSWTVPATVLAGKYRVYVQMGFDTSILASAYSASTIYLSRDATAVSTQVDTVATSTAPRITSVTPTTVTAGTLVTVNGTGFTGATLDTIFYNDRIISSGPVTVTDTKITFTMFPYKLNTGSYKLNIFSNSGETNHYYVNYTDTSSQNPTI